jgi:Sulfotransferase domain
MAERGDLAVLHEPFSNLKQFGETDDTAGGTFGSPASLLAWLGDDAHDKSVFLKDTTDHRYDDVLADRRFLAEARHAFLIRRPDEIAASYYALFPDMNINAIGLEMMCELQDAVRNAGGNPLAVIDSDDLVTRPGATMAAYCAAVGLPFIPRALSWERANGPSGADSPAGTPTSAPVPASRCASGPQASRQARSPSAPSVWVKPAVTSSRSRTFHGGR